MNEIKQTKDPTLLDATFIILDFEKSHNNAVVSKEVAIELGETILSKPIVAHYIPVEDENTTTDNFSGHGASLGKNKHGEETISRSTIPIGVFTSKGYIMTINVDGEETEVLAADATLWKSRFSDACELLVDWFNRGININTSSEFLYGNYAFQDGVEYIHPPVVFEGHCILASENRGEQNIVRPSYDSSRLLSFNEISKFNRMIAEAHSLNMKNENENGTEGEVVKFKKYLELSYEDIRTKIYQAFDVTLPEDTWSYIIQTYDDHFIIEVSGSEYKTYEYKYSKTDDSVTIDFDSKTEVVEERTWKRLDNEFQEQLNQVKDNVSQLESQLQESENKLNSLQDEKKDLESKFNEVNEKLITVAEEKQTISQQFNETTEKLLSLNSEIEKLATYKDKYEESQYNISFNEKKDFYFNKFNAFSAIEKFESEEVQELIKSCARGEEVAQIKLNSILVDLVEVKETKKQNKFEDTYIREYSSRMEDLLPKSNDFDSKYK